MLEPDGDALAEPPVGSPNCARIARDRLGVAPSAGIASTVGRPISRLQLRRRALGDDVAVVDDPDAVGERVGLLEVLRGQEDGHAVLAARAARPPPRARSGSATSRPVVGSSRKRIGGPVREGEREVEPALHPARVAADLAVGRERQPDPLEQLLRRAPALGARDAVQRALEARCSRPVSRWSSAASWSAAPIAVRTFGPSLTMSKPATRAVPEVGGSSVVSMCTVVDLPAPFGPRKP